jgi:hypothetical protein
MTAIETSQGGRKYYVKYKSTQLDRLPTRMAAAPIVPGTSKGWPSHIVKIIRRAASLLRLPILNKKIRLALHKWG